MNKEKPKKVLVIGAGLGGLSAAISLRQRGYDVAVYEKNAQIGGKLNALQEQGFRFDLGPSILTLPHLFERLFTRSGRNMADYVTIRPVRPHWRNFFPDGTVFDFTPERDRMAAEAERLEPGAAAQIEAFLAYAERQYDLVERGYFEAGLDTVWDFMRFYPPSSFFQFDFWRSMHRSVAHYLRNPYLRDAFDFFIKYVGSSAYDAPGFMNCLPVIQFRHDLWYIDGGMYRMATGLGKLMDELGIPIHLNCEVQCIRKQGQRVTGIELNSGEFIPADVVVSNREVVPTYENLLGEKRSFLRRLRRFEPSCSGLIIDLGLDRRYEFLAHHNFFFSAHQKRHFHTVFREKRLPDDPTIYLVAAARTDPTVAPPGCENLKILPHIPFINDRNPYTVDDYLALKDRILDKLESMGLSDLRRHIVFEHVWTPFDIREQYHSTAGSIYGVVSNRWKNFAFKAPQQSRRYPNLFFAGGSTNPGGGMPMVVLSGQNVARKIESWDRSCS